ncbi:hypothetical protein K438DRAFT_1803883 [Mycena galopus ATCC 62051]|nr:hypothetical protein K438DRAFT_1803883 [Mycena galopus ATCC 62051]
MPSTVPEDAQNLTGVGASGRTPDVFYSTSPFDRNQAPEASFPLILPVEDEDASPPNSFGNSPLGRMSPSDGDGPSHSSSPHPALTPPLDYPSHSEEAPVHEDFNASGTPPQLLSPGAFRDSAFSSASNSTDDVPIPIKWTGAERESLPPFPGGWQPTPIDEKPEDMGGFDLPEEPIFEEHDGPTPDVQDVAHRVESPDLQAADLALRKSEAGLVGLIAATDNPEATEGKGWVVVDVEGQGGESVPRPEDTVVASPEPLSPASPSVLPTSKKDSSGSGRSGAASPSGAIAAVDAIEAKNKSSSKSSKPSNDSSSSGIRKFFSTRRKNSAPPSPAASLNSLGAGSQASKPPTATPVTVDDTKRAIELVHNHSENSKAGNKEKDSSKSGTASRLRDKLRLVGTPEASRVEDKRMSIN